ncbi:MAG: aromatic ring-hydroxylating dioxygenase subunit alpha [Paracoccaceae bacterium]
MDSPRLDHCPPGLPRAAYFAPDWLDRERRTVWARNWVYTGRISDLPPGTMRGVDTPGGPVLLAHAPEGRVTGFHNACRHRGAELCAGERKLGRLITCPYHAWAYDARDGRLVATGMAKPTADFDKGAHGLMPVAVQVWRGLVMVNLSPDPPPLTADVALDTLDRWPLESLITGHRITRDLACNWKVFWENYSECLHCPGIHPELCDMVPIYQKGIMAPAEAADWVPGTSTPDPLKPGAVTWTADGRACGPIFPGLTPAEYAAGFTFVTLWPTAYIVAHIDHMRIVSLTPTGPETTRLTAEWLFPAETLAQPGFSAAEVAKFATLVMDQDGAASEMNQRGFHSPAFAQGTLMPEEYEIHRFHRWILDQMEDAR